MPAVSVKGRVGDFFPKEDSEHQFPSVRNVSCTVCNSVIFAFNTDLNILEFSIGFVILWSVIEEIIVL